MTHSNNKILIPKAKQSNKKRKKKKEKFIINKETKSVNVGEFPHKREDLSQQRFRSEKEC